MGKVSADGILEEEEEDDERWAEEEEEAFVDLEEADVLLLDSLSVSLASSPVNAASPLFSSISTMPPTPNASVDILENFVAASFPIPTTYSRKGKGREGKGRGGNAKTRYQ